jgi:hypothetical protein
VVRKPTPQAEERLAEASYAVSHPPSAEADTAAAPAAHGTPLANGDVHDSVDSSAAVAEVASAQEPALKVGSRSGSQPSGFPEEPALCIHE